MKSRILSLIYLGSILFFQNCSESTLDQKQTLTKTDLQLVLQTKNSFTQLVEANVNFSKQQQAYFANLPDEKKSLLASMVEKSQTLDNFLENISQEEKDLFINSTKIASESLANNFENLVTELNRNYNFREDNLIEILKHQVTMINSKESQDGRIDSAPSCGTTCSNEAESVYWMYYGDTRNVDLSAAFANTAYYGCMVGCKSK